MKTLKMYDTSINNRYVDEAVEALSRGQVLIVPTDTVYALVCDALNNNAIEKLCRLKGIDIDPRKQTLSILCSGLSMASEYARIDNEAYRILHRNLPGPFTFILPASTKLPKVFKGRRNVGIRIPDSPIATAIVEALGHPILTTSAVHGDDDPTDPAGIANIYEGVASLLIDGGECPGIESAVIDITDSRNPEILREGPIELS